MKHIEIKFSPSLFFGETRRESFYNDPLPDEYIDIAGFFQPPIYREQPDDFNPSDYILE